MQKMRLEDTEQKEETCLPLLKSEDEWTIKSFNVGKSPGCDNIQAEMIKQLEQKE